MLGLLLALAAAELIGFGVAGLVVQWSSGPSGASQFLVGGGAVHGAHRQSSSRWPPPSPAARRAAAPASLALALVVWFVAVILFDLAALGVASLLRSGAASRLLITAALVNPVDAGRTGAYMAIEGTSAFGGASLALLRFAGGERATAALIAASLLLWIAVPSWIAARRLARTDL